MDIFYLKHNKSISKHCEKHSELDHIQKDAQRLEVRATNLNKHFNLASKDLEEIKISSSKISEA